MLAYLDYNSTYFTLFTDATLEHLKVLVHTGGAAA